MLPKIQLLGSGVLGHPGSNSKYGTSPAAGLAMASGAGGAVATAFSDEAPPHAASIIDASRPPSSEMCRTILTSTGLELDQHADPRLPRGQNVGDLIRVRRVLIRSTREHGVRVE